MVPPVTLRDTEPQDTGFLYEVYASTREEEMALVDWGDEDKEAFLRMQFDAQHRYYQEHYASASFQIILADGIPCGCLYVDRWEDEIRIIDIALLPPYRNHGIGTSLLGDILAEGRQARVPVSIHVERFNPALSLYRRLGFRAVEGQETGVYLLMRWSPEGPSDKEANV